MKKIVHRIDPDVEVYVFGSVVRGTFTGGSDIDILVVTEKLERKYDMMVEVYRRIDAPVELHIVSERELREWYYKFIDPNELVRV